MNDQDQLKALCGNRNWFAPSSIIIITTRDIAILDYLEPNYVHKMEEMRRMSPLSSFVGMHLGNQVLQMISLNSQVK